MLFVGCLNPNPISPSIIQDKKSIVFQEKDFKDTLFKLTYISKTKEQLKNHLKVKLPFCLKDNFITTTHLYFNQRISNDIWYDLKDKTIKIENYTSNFMKDRSRKSNDEKLVLGGEFGNNVYGINLPYSITKVSEDRYMLEIFNNKNIEVTESFNVVAKKPYEPYVYMRSIEDFKKNINRAISCIKN